MQMASPLQRISSSVKFLVFRPRFHGAGQIFEWTKTCIERSFVYAGPKQNRASFFNWQAKGSLGERPRTRVKGGSFPPFLPPSLPPSFTPLALPKSPSLPLRTPAMQGNVQQNLHGSVWAGCTGKKFVRWKVWKVWPDLCKGGLGFTFFSVIICLFIFYLLLGRCHENAEPRAELKNESGPNRPLAPSASVQDMSMRKIGQRFRPEHMATGDTVSKDICIQSV